MPKTITIDDYIDLPTAEVVEVTITKDRLWVNTEKGCILRIYRIKRLELVDNRNAPKGWDVAETDTPQD